MQRSRRGLNRSPHVVSTDTRQPFIVLDGIDGAGKSTQARMLTELLQGHGHRVCSTYEPSHLSVGTWLRGQLHSGAVGLDELTRCYLFAADRAQHLNQVIQPALDKGEVVICDRYLLSTLAYQRSDPDNQISLSRLLAIHTFPAPRLTLWLEIDPEVAMQRMSSREDASVYEEATKLSRIADNYAELAEHPMLVHHNIVKIDASGSKLATFDQISEAVHNELQSPPCP